MTSNHCLTYEEACGQIRQTYIRLSPTPSDWVVEESSGEPRFLKATLTNAMCVNTISTIRMKVHDTSYAEVLEGSFRQDPMAVNGATENHTDHLEEETTATNGSNGQLDQSREMATNTIERERAVTNGEARDDATWAPSHKYVLSWNGTLYRWPAADIPLTRYSDLRDDEWGVGVTSSPDQYDGEGTVVIQDEGVV